METSTEATTSDDQVMSNDDLFTEKIIVMIAMLVVTFLVGMIPLKLFSSLRNNPDQSSRQRWKTVVSFCSCFAGGVFIAACFLDLFPELEEQIASVLEQLKQVYDVDIDYPVSQFIIVLGLFLILLIEQTVLHFQEKWAADEERQVLLDEDTLQHQHSHGSYQQQRSQGSVHQHGHGSYQQQRSQGSVHQHGDDVDIHCNDGHHGHNHGAMEHSSLRSILLVIALSFHSIFEGLSLGLQKTNDGFISILIAVVIHKAVIAFSLGLNIAQSNLSVRSFILSNFIFSIANPIGMGIGIAVSGLPPSLPSDITSGVLQGLCGGTFLYITFFEVLPLEINVPGNRLWKVFFVILGYICIFGLLLIAE